MSQEALSLAGVVAILLAGASLLVGWYQIRRRRSVAGHRAAMIVATGLSAVFLLLYVTRWTRFGSTPFTGEGAWKSLYLGILAPHVVLAAAVGPLALYLIYLAAKRRDYAAHRRLARVVLPVWLFVSASGWAIYLLLHRLPR